MLPSRVKLWRKRKLKDLGDAVETRKQLVLKRVVALLHRQGPISPVVR
jgi:hypothetical protein